MTTHKIKKGFDLPLAGRPEQVLADAAEPAHVALETFEFAGIKPKVLVKEGDAVETGQPVYLNKVDRDIVWCAPASGTVKSIEFGPRRFLTRVVIEVVEFLERRFGVRVEDADVSMANCNTLRGLTELVQGRLPA